jgi:hypothetical protein
LTWRAITNNNTVREKTLEIARLLTVWTMRAVLCDELDEAADRGKKPGRDASKEAVEEEESTGGVKDNVEDEWDESQER